MDRKAWQRRICNRVREVRRRLGLSQMAYAGKAGLSFHTIGKIERGEVFPTLETLIALSEAHGAPLSDFVAEPAPAKTPKDRTLRDLLAVLRGQDDRKLRFVDGLVRDVVRRWGEEAD